VLVFVLALAASALACCSCPLPPTYGPENLFPINNYSQNMVLVMTVNNGKLYNVTVPNSGGNTTSYFSIMHLWGNSAYEMGYTQGLMLGSASAFVSEAWAYLESEVEAVLTQVPAWLAAWIANLGLDAALDLTYDASVEFTPPYFYEELQGISDGSGLNYLTLRRLHMLAGLTQGKCSMAGLWGAALSPSSSTKLMQLRALDWNMDGPFPNFAQITVYHPPAGVAWHSFANIGFPGFIGGLTGVSASQLGISEIGVDFPDSTFGEESYLGIPFVFLLRDILMWDYTVDDAITRMIDTRRTCDLILGVGDGKLAEFRGFAYSWQYLVVMDDLNMLPYNETWHPRITDAVYWGMDWICPTVNLALGTLLQQEYGTISLDSGARNVTAREMSGDNHVAWYDLTNMVFDVAFAAPHWTGGSPNAYARQFTRVDALALFAEQPPANSTAAVRAPDAVRAW